MTTENFWRQNSQNCGEKISRPTYPSAFVSLSRVCKLLITLTIQPISLIVSERKMRENEFSGLSGLTLMRQDGLKK